MRAASVLSAVLLLVSACASAKSNDNELQTVQPQPKRSSTVISESELQDPQITSRDAYTAIRMLRPNFFAYRGPTGSSEPGTGEVQVSQDYGPLQSAQTLKAEKTFGLVEVRYLNPSEAALRFGLNANGGPVIVLLHNKNQ